MFPYLEMDSQDYKQVVVLDTEKKPTPSHLS